MVIENTRLIEKSGGKELSRKLKYEKNSINDQVLQISLCRKGSWDNSGLPNALNHPSRKGLVLILFFPIVKSKIS